MIEAIENKLSEYVRIAAAGETVLVTNRDRVVAELGPPRPERSSRLADAALAAMVREGILTPAVAPRSGRPPESPRAMPLDDILGLVDEIRA